MCLMPYECVRNCVYISNMPISRRHGIHLIIFYELRKLRIPVSSQLDFSRFHFYFRSRFLFLQDFPCTTCCSNVLLWSVHCYTPVSGQVPLSRGNLSLNSGDFLKVSPLCAGMCWVWSVSCGTSGASGDTLSLAVRILPDG